MKVKTKMKFGKNIINGSNKILTEAIANAQKVRTGWLGEDDMQTIASYYPNSGKVLEIGTAMGKSAVFMASLNPDIQVYTIDSLEGYEIHDGTEDKKEKNRKELKRNIASFPNITFVEGNSRSVAWKDPLNLLFIDGNHKYSWVQNDFDRFSPFVVSGGIVLFHDIANAKAEVKKFIEDRKLEVVKRANMGVWIKL